MEVTAEEALLIRLLRLRTDIGSLTLRRALTGVYMAGFNFYGEKTFVAADRLDPVSALVDALLPEGVDLGDLARIAAAQTPKFDIANTPEAVIKHEVRVARRDGRQLPQAVLDIQTAKQRGEFVGTVKPKPAAKIEVKAKRGTDLEDIL